MAFRGCTREAYNIINTLATRVSGTTEMFSNGDRNQLCWYASSPGIYTIGKRRLALPLSHIAPASLLVARNEVSTLMSI